MSKPGIGSVAKAQLIERFLGKKAAGGSPIGIASTPGSAETKFPSAWTQFDQHPDYQKILISRAAGKRFGIDNPFFRSHDGVAGATTLIDGHEFVNFSSYNYLGLSGDPAVDQAAKDAIDRYGTSASASRLVAGERPVQRDLERAIAELYGVDDCVVFVSGHATNVGTIGYLFGPKDLVVHDSLIHNSVLEGIRLSGAARRVFPHNDYMALDALLSDIRGQFERVLIVAEGLYSMDGDVPELAKLVAIKRRHQALLMIDEAHSLGVLGATGRGLHEFQQLAGRDVDIWMGTLSKAFAGCGGYIAGDQALIEHLKYAAPAFVYSVGMSPPLAAASLRAIQIMLAEPERVRTLHERSAFFLQRARHYGIDTGLAQGYAVVPAVVGDSVKAVRVSNQLFERGFNVQPIIYPAVEERAARLRFFISCQHNETQIDEALRVLRALI